MSFTPGSGGSSSGSVAQSDDVALNTPINDDVLTFEASTGKWRNKVTPISSVAGKTGAVTLAKADVGLASVDNTADSDKPISTAQAAAFDQRLVVLIHNGTAYPARPSVPAGMVQYKGPTQPTTWLTGDTWIAT